MTQAFLDDVDDLKSHKQVFCLHPQSWANFTTTALLDWGWVKFEDDKLAVPASRGVYAFVVEPDIAKIFQHGFPFYIGETGDTNQRTLRDRYGDYLGNKRNIRGRHGIYYMLNKWGSHMYFYYAEIPDTTCRLKLLESALNDSLLPPFSVRDFSATVRPKVRALRL